MSQNTFNIIGLFDFDADADRVDGGFDKDMFVLVTRDMHWIQNYFGRCPESEICMVYGGVLCFDLWYVVPFDDLAGEVFET